MPSDKDFKRVVRARMQKTGESYTTARARLLQTASPRTSAPPAAPGNPAGKAPAPADFAALAGMSDAAVKAATGCGWQKWVFVLDKAQAHQWTHAQIARHIRSTYQTPSWWAQMVTVGYERIRGLRVSGQQRDGGFRASKSRTIGAPLARLYHAFSDTRTRRRWLPGKELTVTSSTPLKYFRGRWSDGTSVEFGFLGKGKDKSQVAVQQGRLPDKAAVVRSKLFWDERFRALAALLTDPG